MSLGSPFFLPVVLCILSYVNGRKQSEVTCGSVLKLVNVDYDVKLHSHEVRYGSGSGQQSVTGISDATQSNSYWQVLERNGSPPCVRGRNIKCGQKIRLMHLATRKNLHSHHFKSPLSDAYEVSAFGEDGVGDQGDDWQVVCEGPHWRRNSKIRLKHIATEGYLGVSSKRYNNPIAGQHEVCVLNQATSSTFWVTGEGIYLHPQENSSQSEVHGSTSDAYHNEL
ncbi:Stromal cell-derived factor [Fasciola gigantica]|uniref:Stromal cell-derived factor n=1 Tax=Fasciola gigantica TaxID=46835 RepID=A0A504YG52_FASGI|nr:Stromal cell-derived factor [Fasciola gigantica]